MIQLDVSWCCFCDLKKWWFSLTLRYFEYLPEKVGGNMTLNLARLVPELRCVGTCLSQVEHVEVFGVAEPSY